MRDLEFPVLKADQTHGWKCATVGCRRQTPCVACQKRAVRTDGLKAQRKTLKVLERKTGTKAARFSGQQGNEEAWRLPWRVEVKSGKQVQPVVTAYEKHREQATHVSGDPRPFMLVVVPSAGPSLAVVRLDDLPKTEAG